MKLKLLLLIVLPGVFFGCKQTPPIEYQIIPEPQSITYSSGQFSLTESVKIAFSPAVDKEVGLLKEYLSEDFGMKIQTVENQKDADILLLLNPEVKMVNAGGYKLEVSKRKITIASDSNSGIFNGIQSLRQIIQKREGEFIVQQGIISDFPSFSWRSFMLDEGRHFKGKQVVKQLLDEMALMKMNVFQWHLTEDQGWRIEIRKYPKLTEIGSYRDSTEINHFHSNVYDGKPHSGYYTQAEIREIVAYGSDRHIRIVPEIEMPGHSSAAIAAYPWLGTTGKKIKVPCKFGVQYDIYNVTDPRVITFFNDVVDEVISLFPSPVIHIGGDEVRYDQWSASVPVKSFMAKNGLKTPAELQVFFTNNISGMLQAKNKRMMGWNDITGDKLHEYQSDADTKDVSQKLADGTIVQFWKGDTSLIVNTIKKGYEIVNSYHEYTYLDYDYKSIPLSKAYSFNPIPKGLPKDMEAKVLGLGCQMWGEFIPTVESMNLKVYPRLAAYAECGWSSQEKKNYDRFQKSLPYFLNRWKSKGISYGPIS